MDLTPVFHVEQNLACLPDAAVDSGLFTVKALVPSVKRTLLAFPISSGGPGGGTLEERANRAVLCLF